MLAEDTTPTERQETTIVTKPRRATVLLGFAEALAAPEVVWSLVDAGFRLVAFARKGRACALRHSRHVLCHEICAPESDLDTALSDIQAVIGSLDAELDDSERVLFPLDDKAVWLCSQVQLRRPWVLAGPSGAQADLALNKYLQIQIARLAGFDVPRTSLARNANDILSFVAAESFPIILKSVESVPRNKGRVYGCRKWICANHKELECAISEWAEKVPLLVQSFVTGIGEGVFGLATADGVRAWSAHRRLRMMNPHGSGSSACISQPLSYALRDKVEAFLRKAEWSGLFMIELLRDNAGKTWFVELNGRPWGSMALSRRQGFEYPAWHLTLATDHRLPECMSVTCTPGLVCRHLGRELMHLLFLLRGRKSKAISAWPSLWNTLREVIGVRPGDGFYNWRRDDPQVFVADFYYTIRDNLLKHRS